MKALMTQEQALLKQSIWATMTLAIIAIIFGLWVNSQSIEFDGFYALVDSVITITALYVTKLIAKEASERFQFGYWHLEPIVASVNGLVLGVTCLYAFVNGINALLQGGREVNFELGLIYTIFASLVSFFMYFYISVANRKISSEFLRIDSQAWLIGGVLSFGLCAAFLFAILVSRTKFEYLTVYADPVIIITLSILLIQVPVRTIWKSLREVFIVTPVELDEQVTTVMEELSKKYKFNNYKTYVAKRGRAQFIEINVLISPENNITVTYLDKIREEIAAQLRESKQKNWLTIMFTTDERWL
jgi:cation diffusion facilitator family transporter